MTSPPAQNPDKPRSEKQSKSTELFVWGSDKRGQLGIESQYKDSQRPLMQSLPRSCSFSVIISQMSCGERHSAIITQQGYLYTMGSNHKGQLGVPLADKQIGTPTLVESLKSSIVTQVSCGHDTTVCIASDSEKAKVWAWGANKYGQLGLPYKRCYTTPHQLEVLDAVTEIVQVSCGDKHTVFLSGEGEVIATGQNSNGQCGFNTNECLKTDQPYKLLALQNSLVKQVSAGF